MSPSHAVQFASPDDGTPMLVSIAVPVFNNAASLIELNQRLQAVARSIDEDIEIVYVNDGSTDHSLDILTRIVDTGDNVRVVDLDGNFGQSSAILAAMSVAMGGIVVTIDADLENHPEDIPALVSSVNEGADLVCGLRQSRRSISLARRVSSWLANQLVARGLGVSLRDWGCGLNAVRRQVTQQILEQDPLPTLPKIEAALLASQIDQVEVAYSDREHGPSSYTPWRLAGFAVAFFRSFSVRRSLRRLWKPVVNADESAPGTNPGRFRRFVRLIVAAAAWALLSALALLVRLGLLLTGSLSSNERFRIRNVLGKPAHLNAAAEAPASST